MLNGTAPMKGNLAVSDRIMCVFTLTSNLPSNNLYQRTARQTMKRHVQDL